MPEQISIAVMPFKNMTGDTLFNLWQGGMQNLLITSLSNSEELTTIWNYTIRKKKSLMKAWSSGRSRRPPFITGRPYVPYPRATVSELQAILRRLELSWNKEAEAYCREAHATRLQDDYFAHEFALFLIENDINLEEGMELITPVAEMYPKNASY